MPVHIERLRYANNHIIRAIKLVVLISYHCYPVNANKVCKVVAKQVPFLAVKSNLLTDSGIVADSSQWVNKVEHWFSVLIKDHKRCVIEVSIANEILMYFRNQKKTAQDVFISDPIDTDKDGNALTLIDVIADESDIAEEIDKKIKLEKLRVIMSGCLDEREKSIIEMRYGLGGKEELTQRDIAKRLNISRSYVSRIEKAALEKLRRKF